MIKKTATKGWWMTEITGEVVIEKPCKLVDDDIEVQSLGILNSQVAVMILTQRMNTDSRPNLIHPEILKV